MRHSLLTASFGECQTSVKEVRSAHAGFASASASLTLVSRSPFSLPRAKGEISTDADKERKVEPNQPSELEDAERIAPLTRSSPM